MARPVAGAELARALTNGRKAAQLLAPNTTETIDRVTQSLIPNPKGLR
jgi:hypothetical protein